MNFILLKNHSARTGFRILCTIKGCWWNCGFKLRIKKDRFDVSYKWKTILCRKLSKSSHWKSTYWWFDGIYDQVGNCMKGLLVKDLSLMIKSKKVILFMLFIGIIGGINDISFATGYILMVLAILSLSTISYDEANHGLKTLFTLPISKSDYVKEKYLFSLIITGIGFVFVTILGCFRKSALWKHL